MAQKREDLREAGIVFLGHSKTGLYIKMFGDLEYLGPYQSRDYDRRHLPRSLSICCFICF